MKHVFYLNSHTTFLTVLGTIEYLKIDTSDVIFLYTRNYKHNIPCNSVAEYDFTQENDICNDCYGSRTQLVKAIKLIDDFVDEKIKDDYILYIPHLHMGTAQLLYTNPRCIKVAYVQEGAICQPKKFVINIPIKETIKNIIKNKLLLRTKRVWRGIGWYQSGTLNKQKSIDSYSFSKDFFKYLPSSNHIVKWPKLNIETNVKSGSTVFVFDGHVTNGLVEREYYYNVCKLIISKFAGENNYVKFHPAQQDDEREYIKSLFAIAEKSFSLCDDATPFELVLSNVSNLRVIGFGSSLLMYAHLLGHEVYAKDNLLLKSPLYQKYLRESDFPCFNDITNKQN